MSKQDEQRKFERWWLHKRVRRACSGYPFKFVTKVRVIGPPSGFNAIVELTYDDGTDELIGPPAQGGYKPRKFDLEIDTAPAPSPSPAQGGAAAPAPAAEGRDET